MRYLIDGHNLIAQLPDIDLADEDDEAQLVFKLRSFCASTGKKVTVVFDGGLPGGTSTTLSNSAVTAKFASSEHSTADQILLGMVRQIKNTRAYTIVSSDQEILSAAQACGIPILRTPQFIAMMNKAGIRSAVSETDDKDENVRLSAAEVEEWLAIFSRQQGKKF